jgi:transposase
MEPNGSRYATDLTDGQWARVEPLLPKPDPRKGGRPRRYSHREILNALFYIEKTGCQWRMLPREFPHWNLVWQYFRRWRDDGTLERIRLALNREVRRKAGREALPSVALVDSQSAKTALKGGSAASTGARRSRAGSVTS